MQVGVLSDSIEMINVTFTAMKGVEHRHDDSVSMNDHRAPENGQLSGLGGDEIAIAVYSEDPEVTFHPPVQRAINIVQAALDGSNICVRRLSFDVRNLWLIQHHRLSLGGRSSMLNV